jgi:hypothetical protein
MKVTRPELVLAGAVLVSLPMVPGILSGGIDPTAALIRFLLALVVCWVAGGVVSSVLSRYSEASRQAEVARLIERAQQQIVEQRKSSAENA